MNQLFGLQHRRTLLEICEKESIPAAVFSGIGGCQSAEL